jgi:hypothetical protein
MRLKYYLFSAKQNYIRKNCVQKFIYSPHLFFALAINGLHDHYISFLSVIKQEKKRTKDKGQRIKDKGQYATQQGLDQGIAAVKKNALFAEIVEIKMQFLGQSRLG